MIGVCSLHAVPNFDMSVTIGADEDTANLVYHVVNLSSDSDASSLVTFSLMDFYSSTAPMALSVPVGWDYSYSETDIFQYTLNFFSTGPEFYLQPFGDSLVFELSATKPAGSGNFELVNIPSSASFADGNQLTIPSYAVSGAFSVADEGNLLPCLIPLLGLFCAIRKKSRFENLVPA
jgi:hypothetical protein